MTPLRLDFHLPTNGDYNEELTAANAGQAVDITGYSFKAQVKSSYDANDVLKTLTTVASTSTEGFCIIESASGILHVRISKDTAAALYSSVNPSIYVGRTINIPYDMVVTLPNGDDEQWLYGYMVLPKGITNG